MDVILKKAKAASYSRRGSAAHTEQAWAKNQETYKKNRQAGIPDSRGKNNKGGTPEAQAKRRATCLKRYGVDHISVSPDKMNNSALRYQKFYQLLRAHHLELLSTIDYNQPIHKQTQHVRCLLCGYEFDLTHCTTSYVVKNCPYCNAAAPQKRSNRELYLQKYYTDFGIRVEHCPHLLKGYEVDLYFPDYNVAVECNGYFYHSSCFKEKAYHKRKTELALEKGISLYHFWEDTPTSFITSFLNKKFGDRNLKKLRASDCEVREDFSAVQLLTEKYHVSGSSPLSSRNYALYYKGTIVAGISFNRRPGHWELARYVTDPSYLIHGAFTKLLKYAKPFLLVENPNLTTYCDRDLTPDWHTSVYARCGFKFEGDSGPILSYYVKKPFGKFNVGKYTRQYFQKQNLSKYWDDVDLRDSEKDICWKHGVYQVYNSGNWKFSLDLRDL